MHAHACKLASISPMYAVEGSYVVQCILGASEYLIIIAKQAILLTVLANQVGPLAPPRLRAQDRKRP